MFADLIAIDLLSANTRVVEISKNVKSTFDFFNFNVKNNYS